MKNLNIKSTINRIKKLAKLESKHAAFIAIIFVLLTYVFLVWRIGSYTTAEPTITEAVNKIPSIDKNAIKNIEELQKNNPDIKAFFNEARKDPFQE